MRPTLSGEIEAANASPQLPNLLDKDIVTVDDIKAILENLENREQIVLFAIEISEEMQTLGGSIIESNKGTAHDRDVIIRASDKQNAWFNIRLEHHEPEGELEEDKQIILLAAKTGENKFRFRPDDNGIIIDIMRKIEDAYGRPYSFDCNPLTLPQEELMAPLLFRAIQAIKALEFLKEKLKEEKAQAEESELQHRQRVLAREVKTILTN